MATGGSFHGWATTHVASRNSAKIGVIQSNRPFVQLYLSLSAIAMRMSPSSMSELDDVDVVNTSPATNMKAITVLLILAVVHAARDQCTVQNRTDCGYVGIQEQECLNRGCCWSPADNQPYCFVKGSPAPPTCNPTSFRRDCGYAGINQDQCEVQPLLMSAPRRPDVNHGYVGVRCRSGQGLLLDTGRSLNPLVLFQQWHHLGVWCFICDQNEQRPGR